MTRITINNIQKAIKADTGFDVVLAKGNGYFWFTSDDEATGLYLCLADHSAVFTNHLTGGIIDIQWWVDQFQGMLDTIEEDFDAEKMLKPTETKPIVLRVNR